MFGLKCGDVGKTNAFAQSCRAMWNVDGVTFPQNPGAFIAKTNTASPVLAERRWKGLPRVERLIRFSPLHGPNGLCVHHERRPRVCGRGG